MTTFRLAELFGSVCVDPDDGGRLCAEVDNALTSEEQITIDCRGVQTITSSFLNAAIGCLFGNHTPEVLASRISWIGLDDTDLSLVRLVEKNAIRYWRSSAEQRRHIEASTSEPVESC